MEMTLEQGWVSELQMSLKAIADRDLELAGAIQGLERRKAELKLEAAVQHSNDTTRKAAAEAAIANDPDCEALSDHIARLERDKAYQSADVEAYKYLLRLSIARARED